MVFEHFDQPGVMLEKFCSQLGPFAWSPPTLWHFMKIKVEHQSAPLSLHDVAHLDEVRAHAAKPSSLLLLEGRHADRAQCLLVAVDIEIVDLLEQLGSITSIGLAFAVEHFGRHHVCFHSLLAQLAMKSVAKSARLLDQHDSVLASDELARQFDDGPATAFATVNRATASYSHGEH